MYHLYKAGGQWALALNGDPITPLSDKASAERAARFVNVRIDRDTVWDADAESWVCPRCESDNVKDCDETPCDRQDGKPLANHCQACGYSWVKEEVL